MEKIIHYKMSPEAMVMVAGSSIGTQKKFYEKCKINGRDGCRSANFLLAGESYISLQRLYDTY